MQSTTVALLTGGLDVWGAPGASIPAQMRILISTARGSELPQRADGDMFTFGGRRWRGSPSITALPGGASGVVATVDIDSYLYGVLPLEAAAGWPPAALGAQAIVARTYALARRTLSRPYDVVVTQSDQRFGGIEAEHPATNAAVDATRGAVLTFEGGNASVFYAACCGGHTADAAEIWGHTALPYLRGVVDPNCSAAPDYRWQRTIPLDRLRSALAAHVAGRITGFSIGPPDAGGRSLSIDVLSGIQRATLSTIDFRALVGTDIVRSTWIQALDLDNAEVRIAGAGRGHGVGMCQWGARALAAAGSSAHDIVAFYFPGTSVGSTDAAGR